MSKITHPTRSLLQGCEYTPAAKTDITIGWRRLGWLPKAERDAELKAQATVKRARLKEQVNGNS
jgi:hypothetical protein